METGGGGINVARTIETVLHSTTEFHPNLPYYTLIPEISSTYDLQ